MHRRFREQYANDSDPMCRGDKQGKIDAVYETLTEMVGFDLTAHFDTYRIPLTDAFRQRVAAKAYPQPAVSVSSVVVNVGDTIGWVPDGQP